MILTERYKDAHLELARLYYDQLNAVDKIDFKTNMESFTWDYQLIDQTNFHTAFNSINQYECLVIDTETTGLNHNAKVIGLCVGIPALEVAYYFPFGHLSQGCFTLTRYKAGGKKSHEYTERSKKLISVYPSYLTEGGSCFVGSFPDRGKLFWSDQQCTFNQVENLTREIFTNKHRLIFHNSKFDIKMLDQTFPTLCIMKDLMENGSNVGIEDTMLAAKCIDTCKRVSLTEGSTRYLGFSNKPEEVRINWLCKKRGYVDFLNHSWKDGKNYYQLFMKDFYVYALSDIESTAKLWPILHAKIKGAGVKNLYEQEKRVSKIVGRIEKRGIRIDKQYLEIASENCGAVIEALQTRANDIAALVTGEPLDMGKAKQVEAVFSRLGVDLRALSATAPGVIKDNNKAVREGKKAKEISISEEVLKLSGHELGRVMIDWMGLTKLQSTYIDGIKDKLDDRNFLHGSLNQTGADTGRFSSSDPNLQNMPRGAPKLESELKAKYQTLMDSVFIRTAFLPDSNDHVLVKIDYSQMELRMVAWLANVQGMLQAFKEGIDLHALTRDNVNSYLGEEVLDRYDAKTMNFQILYGSGAAGLAGMLGKPVALMYSILDGWHSVYPEVKEAMELAKEIHSYRSSPRWRGYVKNVLGRQYRVETGKEYKLLNYLIQGGCAELVKEKLVAVHEFLEAEIPEARIINTIHDELLFSWPKSKINRVSEVANIMEDFDSEGPGNDGSIRRPAIQGVRMEVEVTICPLNWGAGVNVKEYFDARI